MDDGFINSKKKEINTMDTNSSCLWIFDEEKDIDELLIEGAYEYGVRKVAVSSAPAYDTWAKDLIVNSTKAGKLLQWMDKSDGGGAIFAIGDVSWLRSQMNKLIG